MTVTEFAGWERLIAVTLPGHGGTPPPQDLRIENYVRLAAEFACDVVIGHSYGASSFTASEEPALVARLLVDAIGLGPAPASARRGG